MALVRVYCGLASADRSAQPASASDGRLTAAVVDDAGRLLDVCEVGDDPAGYAQLCTVLAERSGGPTSVAIAADSDDHQVTMLLTAAGRALAFTDDDSADDYAERFADDDSADEMESPAAERRAVGLARALQAGALSAVPLPVPRDLAGLKGILVAHAALTTGRHSSAIALREVLRELHPAALRAYPDPAELVPLAILDALPEPQSFSAGSGRGRESTDTESLVADLAESGIADRATLSDAITALRVAISETPRRGGMNKTLTAAVTETVQHAVAAVRACDAACAALVAALTERLSGPLGHGSGTTEPVRSRAGRRADRAPDTEPVASDWASLPRRGRPAPPAGPVGAELPPRAPAAPAASLAPLEPMPLSASFGSAMKPDDAPEVPAFAPPVPMPVRSPAAGGAPTGGTASTPAAPPLAGPGAGPAPAWVTGTGSNRPVPAANGIGSPRPGIPPAEAGEPFRPTLTAAAMNSVRAARAAAAAEAAAEAEAWAGQGPKGPEAGPPPPSFSPTDFSVPVPLPRPEPAPPGSRANWPLVAPADGDEDDLARTGSHDTVFPFGAPPQGGLDNTGELALPSRLDRSEPGRIMPPWQADDLPPEPPSLRLVEPPPLADRALRGALADGGFGGLGEPGLPRAEEFSVEHRPLRLVEPAAEQAIELDWSGVHNGGARRNTAHRAAEMPVSTAIPDGSDSDGDLLIFAQAKSAWFVGQESEEPDWSSLADFGWQAAEQAAQPSVGEATTAGLPRRVPQANLVPGSPLSTPERPLRIVRDAASIAAHTSGYFRGWRRGQEINGFSVGGRPGRESSRGWDFSREPGEQDADEYGYRSAGHRG